MFNRIIYFIVIFLFVIISVFFIVKGVSDIQIIDTDFSSKGYFSIFYEDNTNLKMKVCLKYNNQKYYYDYIQNNKLNYTFEFGSGDYEIILYKQVIGNFYEQIDSKKISVNILEPLTPYLISTYDVLFEEGDNVSKKANELCEKYEGQVSKVIIIYYYIQKNIKYDYDFAEDVINGKIKNYLPNANNTLLTQKGICYDKASLFAAMCRSQGIPCFIEKGYNENGYHAWNKVYLKDNWCDIDVSK